MNKSAPARRCVRAATRNLYKRAASSTLEVARMADAQGPREQLYAEFRVRSCFRTRAHCSCSDPQNSGSYPQEIASVSEIAGSRHTLQLVLGDADHLPLQSGGGFADDSYHDSTARHGDRGRKRALTACGGPAGSARDKADQGDAMSEEEVMRRPALTVLGAVPGNARPGPCDTRSVSGGPQIAGTRPCSACHMAATALRRPPFASRIPGFYQRTPKQRESYPAQIIDSPKRNRRHSTRTRG
jgi:hypothetical protein